MRIVCIYMYNNQYHNIITKVNGNNNNNNK